MKEYRIEGRLVKQIMLPDPADSDRHPRLIFNGCGLHAGDCLDAWIPGQGFINIQLEMMWEIEGAATWYIATDGYRDLCPVGLWCAVE